MGQIERSEVLVRAVGEGMVDGQLGRTEVVQERREGWLLQKVN